MDDQWDPPELMVRSKRKVRAQTATRRIPPYNVLLENDDYHTLEFVVDVLLKVLGSTVERAIQLALEAHDTGRSVVWTGTKEVAELKVEQIRTFHEIRETDGAKLGPLTCSVEPAPGS